MTVETRYMDSVSQTVNGLTARALDTALVGSADTSDRIWTPDLATTYWGIRVWKRAADGTETEITSGSPVAIATLPTPRRTGTYTVSASWNCPQTSLSSTDSIVVRVYGGTSSPPDTEVLTLTTEQLNAQSLDVATWTVYYEIYVTTDPVAGYDYYVDIGDATNSRIENFTWTPYVPPVARRLYSDGLTLIAT